MVKLMNKIEIDLMQILIRVEQDAALITAYYGDTVAISNLKKDISELKVVLFKLLSIEE